MTVPRLRLFVAVDTPPSVKERILALQEELKQTGADVRWEPPEKVHATLKFLGATDQERLVEIISTIETTTAGQQGFRIVYREVGCFPSMRRPRVVWIGMDDTDGRLRDLQQRIESSMEKLGFTKEDRPFHPHITLCRVKGDKNLDVLLRRLETVTFESQPVEIREVALVRSDLRANGSVYTTLKSFPLSR